MVKQSKIPPILDLLAEPKTIDEISKHTGRSYPALWSDLNSLVDDGFLVKVEMGQTDSNGSKYAYVSAYILSSK